MGELPLPDPLFQWPSHGNGLKLGELCQMTSHGPYPLPPGTSHAPRASRRHWPLSGCLLGRGARRFCVSEWQEAKATY